MVMGSALTGVGLSLLAADHEARVGASGLSWGIVGVGVAEVALGATTLLFPREGEKLLRHFQEKISAPGYDPTQLVMHTETQLSLILKHEQAYRSAAGRAGWLIGTTAAAGLIANELLLHNSVDKLSGRATGAVLLSAGVALILNSNLMMSPTEQLIRIWQKDPSIKNLPRMSVTPLSGGGMVSLEGRF